MFENIDIAIVAPFPTIERVKEGWMSRIGVVDTILNNRKRLYIHLAEHHVPAGRLEKIDENGWEICISPSDPDFKKIVGNIFDAVQAVYVHTVHLAEFVMPWLNSGKVIVDFHGIVPEEEAMLGRPELSGKYELIEQEVLKKAKACVMVTRAMQRHYSEKYSSITPEVIVLPIVEAMKVSAGTSAPEVKTELPVRVVYAGGTQVWQNVEGMLKLAGANHELAEFTFLSHDWKLLEQQGMQIKLSERTVFKFCAKHALEAEYMRHDFGLVLRDDTAVNRVACPTKLYEYMAVGLIPVVRSPSLGDFLELGYAYVTEEEFSSEFFPDSVSRKMMQEKNRNVVLAMRQMFMDGSSRLQAKLRLN